MERFQVRLSSVACILACLVGCGGDPAPPGVAGGTGGATGSSDASGIIEIFVGDVPDIGGRGGSDIPDTRDVSDVVQPGELGWPCLANTECNSDWCVDTADGKQCSELCIDYCAEGWGCKKVPTLGGDEVLICLPLFPNLCEPCRLDEECGSGLGDIGDKCVPRPDGLGSFCGGDCALVSCPEGYECQDIDFGAGGGVKKQCVLSGDAECSCSDSAIGSAKSTDCSRSNEIGTCAGTRACGPEGLTPCSAATPAEEACDGEDNNCDGTVDEEDASGCTNYYPDVDGDNFGADDSTPRCLCAPDGSYKAVETGDCDDKTVQIGPGAAELCNDKDDNCNDEVDEQDALGCKDYWVDSDNDTWGDEADKQCLCEPSAPYVSQKTGDCDDKDEDTYPGAPETCSGKDTNCDDQVGPENTPGCLDYYWDADDDGYGVTTNDKCLCAPDSGYSTLESGDCDDENKAVHPAADEACGDGVDNDCDGSKDEVGAVGCELYYKDADTDGFGDDLDSTCRCAPGGAYTTLVKGDCDDSNKLVNPNAEEKCNLIDDNCSLTIDEEGAAGCTVYYLDEDKDGYGLDVTKCICTPEYPWTADVPGDCDDEIAELAPDVAEECGDKQDNDCDGLTDEADANGCTVYYQDSDDDGYGQSDSSQCLCEPDGDFTAELDGDCEDNDKAISPKATEICDTLDNNCNEQEDEPGAEGCLVYYEDLDKDGWGVEASSMCLCGPELPYLALQFGDCKDGNDSVHPAQTEVCGDGVDNDCNDGPDEEGAQGCTSFFKDEDGDTWGLLGTDKCLCAPDGLWTASKGGDCDDTPGGGLVFPGEQCVAASCGGHLLTQPTVCDGSGTCAGGETAPCPGGFKCADSKSCYDSCVADKQCVEGSFCVAGKCSGKKADGSPCFDGTQCLSGVCNNGFCCDTAGAGTGVCCGGSDTHCNDNDLCTIDVCDTETFQCTTVSNEGAECAASGCDANVWTAPMTCNDGQCTEGGGESNCIGENPCKLYACTKGGCAEVDAGFGSVCAPQSCDGDLVTSALQCDQNAGCNLGGFTSKCAGGFNCADALSCGTSCEGSGQCQSGYYCDDSLCLKKKPDGSPCLQDLECTNAFCNNGFCCSGGDCCANATDCDDGNACTTDTCLPTFVCIHQSNTLECKGGTCDGLTYTQPRFCAGGQCPTNDVTEGCDGGNPCEIYSCTGEGCGSSPMPIGNTCAPPVCIGNKLTTASSCDGEGSCALGGTKGNCPGGFVCAADGVSCKSSCQVPGDCQSGLWCNAGYCQPKQVDGGNCTDNDECSSGWCSNGFCCGDGGLCCSKDLDCDDNNVCTSDTCSQTTHKCVKLFANGVECEAGSCSGLEYTNPKTCFSGTCSQGGNAKNCEGSNPCRIYGCNVEGCTQPAAAAGTVCEGTKCVGASTFTAQKTCNSQGQCSVGGGQTPCPGGFSCEDTTACKGTCTGDTDCQLNWYCAAGGACQPKRENGDVCIKAEQCSSGYCSNGFCCPGGTCCNTDLHCDDGDVCTTDNCLAELFVCSYDANNNQCAPGSCAGLSFTNPKTCSGFACSGGGGEQDCEGDDPCKLYSCSSAGCDISNATAGTQCTATTCAGYEATAPKTCNGGGGCTVGGGTSPCPGGFACETATKCRTSCGTNTHCAPEHFCGANACQPKRLNGDACSTAAQCASGYCANGYCCAGATGDCCAQDFHCNDNNDCTDDSCGFAKKCEFTPNVALCQPAKCDGLTFTGAVFCADGACTDGGLEDDCSGGGQCKTYGCSETLGCVAGDAAANVQCEAQSCTGHTLKQARTCDGSGFCALGGLSAPCAGGYACADGTTCKSTCTAQTDCQLGYYCQNDTCQPERGDGDTCNASIQCESEYCSNGYCCENDGSDPMCCGGVGDQCDDANTCTTNICNPASRCEWVDANGKECLPADCSGTTHTSKTWCLDGECTFGGTTEECTSTEACALSLCTSDGCELQPLPQFTPCEPSSCAGSLLTGSKSCDGAGACVAGGTTGSCPGGFVCATATSCKTACTNDNDCQTGRFCDEPACSALKKNGSQCGEGTECQSGYCNSGFCCDTGQCCQTPSDCDDDDVCTDDTCTNNICGHTDNTQTCVPGSCNGLLHTFPSQCQAGECEAPNPSFDDCSQPNACKTSICTDLGCATANEPSGTQCAAPTCVGAKLTQARTCNGGGSCSSPQAAPCAGNLKCVSATTCRESCAQDVHCVAGYYCSGAGQCLAKKASGATCGGSSECLSDHCNQNICCAAGKCCTNHAHCEEGNPCTTDSCQSFQCAQFNNNGLCEAGTCENMDHTAAKYCSSGSCSLGGQQSACGGSNPCLVYACTGAGCVSPPATQGTSCATATCAAGVLTQAKACDGGGNCSEGGTIGPCAGNYACLTSEECRGSCDLDTHCAPGFYCVSGNCLALKDNGETCVAGLECASAWCSNGFCCSNGGTCCAQNLDCDDTNVCTTDLCNNNACAQQNNTATCGTGSCSGLVHTSAATCEVGACTGGGATLSCDGSDPCKSYSCTESGCGEADQPAGTTCAQSGCSGWMLTTPKTCNSGGTCNIGGVTSACPNHLTCLDSTKCRTGCSQDGHCQEGYYCLGGGCFAKRSDGSSCSSANECQSDYCDSGLCCAGGTCCTSATPCIDGNSCTADACSGFSCTNTPSTGQACAAGSCDGLTYTAPKFCDNGSCTAGGTQTPCGGDNSCMSYGCSQFNGCFADPKSSSTICGAASCAGTIFTSKSLCDGFGNCVPATPVQCDNAVMCDGPETCDATQGCKDGNPNAIWVCGDSVCNPDCEDADTCAQDCKCVTGHSIQVGEFDDWNTASTGGTNRLSTYSGCGAALYPGNEFAYAIVAPLTGQMKVELGGADADTDILVIAGEANGCDPAECVAKGVGTGSVVTWSAQANKTYYIVVDRRTSGATDFTVYLRYTAGLCHVPFTEDWNRTPFPRAWSVEANWQTSQDSPFGATHPKFAGTPVLTDFERSLTSPIFDTSACANTQLTVSWRYKKTGTQPGSVDVTLTIEASSNGGQTWTEIFSYDTSGGDKVETGVEIPASALAGSAQARLRFRISGDTTQYLEKLQVDDVKIDAP